VIQIYLYESEDIQLDVIRNRHVMTIHLSLGENQFFHNAPVTEPSVRAICPTDWHCNWAWIFQWPFYKHFFEP